jgi:pyruvate dehydrogenase E2 component (dihydrolipoamide acetyltransferase)
MAEIVTMPKLGFDMHEGTLVRWVIAEGEKVAKGAVLAEIETDKATVEVESTFDGILSRQLAPQGEIVPVNTPIAVIAAPGENVDYQALLGKAAPIEAKAPAPATPEIPAPAAAPAAAVQALPPEQGHFPGGAKASPLARRMAAEMGIDLRLVPGSGPGRRIIRKDVLNFHPAPATAAPSTAPTPSIVAPTTLPLATGPAPASQSVAVNRLRAAIGRRMTEAKQQVPHFYVTHEFDVEVLMALRKQINELLPEEEKISVNDFIVRAAALALREFPNLNASLQGSNVLRHGQVNVGVAVAVEGGLLTIVTRDTDRKSLRQIAVEVKAMVKRDRDGKVRPEDIEGSTFSVSNLGMYDVEHFIAIINPPEAAILAVGSARQVPVVKDGEIKPGWRMKATVSADHRVTDGVEAAQFMQALAKYLEHPLRLLV